MSSTVTRATSAAQEPHWSEALLGAPRDLPDSFLPSYSDLVRCYFLRITRNNKKNLLTEMTNHTIHLWEKAGFPVMSNKGVYSIIQRFFDGTNFKYFVKKHQFNGPDFNVLVDIGSCKCFSSISNFEDCTQDECSCLAVDKIPNLPLYFDQKSLVRNQSIVFSDKSLDREKKLEEDQKNRKRKRKEQEQERAEKSKRETLSQFETVDFDNSDQDSDDDAVATDPDATFSFRSDRKNMRKAMPKYKHSMLLSERYHIHERPTVGMINMVVRDLHEEGFLREGVDLEQVMVDRNRVKRLKQEYRKEIVEYTKEASKGLVCIKFDGRKDAKTLVAPSVYRTEEHVTIISEPDGKYRGFYTPKDGTGMSNAQELYDFLVETGSVKSFKAVGCDGPVVNTGHNNGALKILQDFVQKVFQWIICLLHCNELPLRHLIEHIDGKYLGPGAYAGPLMKEIVANRKAGYNLPVVQFQKIEGDVDTDLPDYVSENLNNDCKQLREHCLAIQTGHVPESLQNKTPPDFHQARWLTTAINILWKYERTPRPTTSLKKLTKTIVKAYAPNYFHIKKFWHVKYGATNFFSISQRYQNCGLNKVELALVRKHLQISGYMAHPESILLSAVFDPDENVRHWAVKLILSDRERRAESGALRQFKVPNPINFDAKTYLELIDFDSFDEELITEPPLLFDYSNKELMDCALSSDDLPVPDIPCHSQNNERHVAATTEAAMNAIGPENMHALLLQMAESRSEISKDATKSDFVNL